MAEKIVQKTKGLDQTKPLAGDLTKEEAELVKLYRQSGEEERESMLWAAGVYARATVRRSRHEMGGK